MQKFVVKVFLNDILIVQNIVESHYAAKKMIKNLEKKYAVNYTTTIERIENE